MSNAIDILGVRRRLGRTWGPPTPFGPSGWRLLNQKEPGSILVSASNMPPQIDPTNDWWIHASIAFQDRLPTYDEMQHLHRAAFQSGWSYQVFAPAADHINIHQHALHLWGKLDGTPALPNFGALGSI